MGLVLVKIAITQKESTLIQLGVITTTVILKIRFVEICFEKNTFQFMLQLILTLYLYIKIYIKKKKTISI